MPGRKLCHVIAGEDEARVHQGANLQDEFRRRSVVNGNGDDAGEEASPVRGNPLRTVFSPEDDLFALGESRRNELGRETSRGAGHLLVGVTPPPITVVIDRNSPRISAKSRKKSISVFRCTRE